MNITFSGYNDKLKFKIPIDYFFRLESYLGDQHIYSINRYLERYFEADLITIIRIGGFFGVQRVTIIESFLRNYNISSEFDIDVSSLVKRDQRYWKNHTAKSHFLANLNSPFHLNLRA